MRYLQWGFGFLVFVAVTCSAASHNKGHAKSKPASKSKPHNHTSQSALVTKSARVKDNGSCNWVCDGDDPNGKNVTKYPDGSWSYQIQLDVDFAITVSYNKTTAFLTVYNPKLNATWVSNGYFIAVFNLSTGKCLLVDARKKIFNVFAGITIEAIRTQAELMSIIIQQVNIVLRSSIELAEKISYSFEGFLNSLKNNDLVSFFNGSTDFAKAFQLDFGIYFEGSINIDGFGSLLRPIFVGIDVTSKIGLELFESINGAISYGNKLTIGTINLIYSSLGNIVIDINTSIFANINKGIAFGKRIFEFVLGIPGSFINVVTGGFKFIGAYLSYSIGIKTDGSYLINYGTDDEKFTVSYNKTLNTLSFYNDQLNMIIIADGNVGMYGIFKKINETFYAALVVNVIGEAKVIEINLEMLQNAKLDMQTTLSIIAEAFQKNQELTASVQYYFNFTAYVDAYFNDLDLTNIIDIDTKTILDLHFGAYFEYCKKNDGLDLFIDYQVSFIFNINLGINVIGLNYAKLMNELYLKHNGKFSIAIMAELYKTSVLQLSAGGSGFSKFVFGNVLSMLEIVNGAIGLGQTILTIPIKLSTAFLDVVSGGFSILASWVSFNSGKNNDGSYIINYGNDSDKYSVSYNKTLNTLSFYSDNLKLVIIADGTTGMYSIFKRVDGTLYAALIVNAAGEAKVIEIDLEMLKNEELDIQIRFSILAQAFKLNQELNSSVKFYFNFNAYIQAYFNGTEYTDIDEETKKILELHFGAFFDYTKENNGLQLFTDYQVSFVFNIIIGKTTIGANFAKLMNEIYLKKNGQFKVEVMLQLYLSSVISLKAGGNAFNQFIFANVLTIAGIVKDAINFGKDIITIPGKLSANFLDIVAGSFNLVGSAISFSIGKNSDGGYLINYGSDDDKYSVSYNKTLNTLSFYSDNLKLIIIADGNAGMYAIFKRIEGTLYAALIVNSVGEAKILEIDLETLKNEKLDIQVRFSIIAETFKSNQQLEFGGRFFFNFNLYLSAYFNETQYEYFTDEHDMETKKLLELHFGTFFTYCRENKGNALLGEHGVSMMFNIIVGTNAIGIQYAKLMNGLYADNDGHFTTEMMVEAYIEMQISLQAGENGFKKFVFTNVWRILDAIKFGLGIGQSIVDIPFSLSASFLESVAGGFNVLGAYIKYTFGRNSDGSYLINYGSDTEIYSVFYNKTLNSLVFYNDNLRVVIVADGNSGMYSLFKRVNGTLYAALIIDSTAKAKIVEIDLPALIEEDFDIQARFTIVIEAFKKNQDLSSHKFTFDFLAYITAFFDGSLDESKYNVELLEKLDLNFGTIFEYCKQNNGVKLLNRFKVSFLFNIFLGHDVIGKNLAKLMNDIYLHKDGKFTAKAMAEVYIGLSFNLEAGADGFKQFIFNRVLSILKITEAGINLAKKIVYIPFGVTNSIVNSVTGSLNIIGTFFEYTIGRNTDGSYIINYGNDSDRCSLSYNKTLNTLTLYNDNLNMIIVADGTVGMYAIFKQIDGTLYAALIVNAAGEAKLIEINLPFMSDEGMDLQLRFSLIAKAFQGNQKLNSNVKFYFNFGAFLQANFTGKSYFTNDKDVELRNKLDVYFGAFLQYCKQEYGQDFALNKYQVSEMFSVFAGKNVIGTNYAKLLIEIYTKKQGKFTAKAMIEAYLIIDINIKAGSNGFQHFIFSSVLAMLQIFETALSFGETIVDVVLDVPNTLLGIVSNSFSLVGSLFKVETGKSKDGSYLINYSSDGVMYSVSYNRTLNNIIFYNDKLKLIISADGNLGMYMIFKKIDVKSYAGLIMNAQGTTKLIILNSKALANAKLEIQQRFAIISQILKDQADAKESIEFDFNAYISAFFNGTNDFTGIINSETQTALELHFGAFFGYCKENNGQELHAKYQASFMFNIIVGGNAIGNNFAVLMNDIYLKKEGKFKAEIMIDAHVRVNEAIKTGGQGFLSNLFGDIFKSILELPGNIIGGGLQIIGNIFKLPGALFNAFADIINISGSGTFSISIGRCKDNGFLVNYGNETGNYSVNYNGTHNQAGYYNEKLNLMLVADGNLGIYVIFKIVDENTYTGLLVNVNGGAKLVVENAKMVEYLGLDIPSKFAFIGKIINDNKNFAGRMSFDFNKFVEGGMKIDTFFTEQKELQDALQTYFGAFFEYCMESDAMNLHKEFKVSFVFNIIIGGHAIGNNFASLHNDLTILNQARFSSKIMTKAYAAVERNLKLKNKGFRTYIFSNMVKDCVGRSISIIGIVNIGFGSNC